MSDVHSFPDDLDPALEAELAAFADGALAPDRMAELRARIDADPDLAAAVAGQRAAVQAIAAASAGLGASESLRMRVDGLARRRPARRVRWLPAGGALAATVAAAAVVLVLVTGGDSLTVRSALAAASRPTQAAVTPDPGDARLLRDRLENVVFPNFGGKFGWRPNGTRADRIDGRDTRTVFYERGGRTIAYTIVAGPPLDRPGDAAVSTLDGIELRSLRSGGRTVVTWRRQGHTCVLSGEGVAPDDLAELAAWKGKGSIRF